MSRDSARRKATAITGMLSQLVTIAALALAVYRERWFSWTWNDLSVLGVTGASEALFNGGFIAGGLLGIVFAIGLGGILPLGRVGRYAIPILALGSIGFLSIGALPRNTDLAHSSVVLLFFTSVTVAIILIGLSSLDNNRYWGFACLAVGALMATLHLIAWPWHGTAIPKLFYFVPWSLWTIGVGVILLVKPEIIGVKRG